MAFNLVPQENSNPTPLVAPPAENLARVVEQYLSNFLSDRTREAYQTDFRDFGLFVTKTFRTFSHPKDITKTHVIAYRDKLRESYSPTSINRKMSALSSLFKELQGARLVDINPVEGIKRPKSVAKRPRLGFTDSEVNQILECYPTDTVQGDYLFTRVKGAGEGSDSAPLRRQSVGELLKTTLRKLNLDQGRSLHSSRRTVISNLLENGARIESVATLAGHANINTTPRYNIRVEAIEDNPLLTLRY